MRYSPGVGSSATPVDAVRAGRLGGPWRVQRDRGRGAVPRPTRIPAPRRRWSRVGRRGRRRPGVDGVGCHRDLHDLRAVAVLGDGHGVARRAAGPDREAARTGARPGRHRRCDVAPSAPVTATVAASRRARRRGARRPLQPILADRAADRPRRRGDDRDVELDGFAPAVDRDRLGHAGEAGSGEGDGVGLGDREADEGVEADRARRRRGGRRPVALAVDRDRPRHRGSASRWRR